MSSDNAAAAKPDQKNDPKADLFKDDDDEFEEFESFNPDSAANQDNQDINVWEDNWDDESAETDFSKQLREELAKHGYKAAK